MSRALVCLAVLLVSVQSATAAPSHDWRVAGFVSAVGGHLFDPHCVLLDSAGGNVPNLAFRDDVGRELEWMRQQHMRWFRVIATGHNLSSGPGSADEAAAKLRALLEQVDAFNAAHDAGEAIYVLVALTDYYAPGVPGDRQAYDHPIFKASAVLAAPWYRPGVRSFDFDQEHGFGVLTGMPNYEVFYKPWVQTLVSSASTSHALMGWQLGNELKARGSPRNGISSDQAYGWYLDFTRDMVDTIRRLDGNHLVFTGTQYIAELVDWEYRPAGQLSTDAFLLSGYRERHAKLLDDCGAYCWNVLGLTEYDFNPYALDDALLAHTAGVPVVMTEYGFTLGTSEEHQRRFGGDRAAALRGGLDRPWRSIDGQQQGRFASASDLLGSGLVQGLAAWASPAPGPGAGVDTDAARGITGTPDETALWDAWSATGVAAEARNRAAGVSAACQALRTPAVAPAVAHDAQYFASTGYRVDDAVWPFFTSRGAIATFGYPVSRTFSLLGCPVQMFQRLVMQLCAGQAPALLNLLDPDVFPYTLVNGSRFPGPDDALKAATPKVGDADYGARMEEFVADTVPDDFEGEPVGFAQAFADRGGLEVWGAPISRPRRDPSNASFIYQRFQRGIMHYRAGIGTDSILLADYLKVVLLGRDVPADLAAQAGGSRFLEQYCPGAVGWLCRGAQLPGTDLTFAFEQG